MKNKPGFRKSIQNSLRHYLSLRAKRSNLVGLPRRFAPRNDPRETCEIGDKGNEQEIYFGSRTIPYDLHWGSRKRLRIVVYPELTVRVFAPEQFSIEEIHAAVQKKAAWVARKLDKLKQYHPLPSPRQYINGETIVYLGRQYRLKVTKHAKQPAKLLGRFLNVWVDDKQNTEQVKQAVQVWYRKRAHETLTRYLDKSCRVAVRHGMPEPAISIRSMHRRWGSCSSSGRITLNVHLVQAPVHCIEYVIMHELCHLKHHNHSKSFYSLLTRCMPDWRQRKEHLERVVI